MTPAPALTLSVLDTAPVWQGNTPADALRDTVRFARLVEQLGYHRFWVAEHHNTASIASTCPPVLVAELANATATLRIGSGGVMLPNHPPLVIAEQFATLEAFHPGRIDLGIGRAPGTDPRTAHALRRAAYDLPAEQFAGQVTELLDLFARPGGDDTINAIPAAGNRPTIWLLGTSPSSGELAGRLGLPYAYAHHINPANAESALHAYRCSFIPSPSTPRPHVLVSTLVILADTKTRADRLAWPIRAMITRMRNGLPDGPHTPADIAAAARYTPEDEQQIDQHLSERIIGDPHVARDRITALIDRLHPDELMAITLIQDVPARARCYELLTTIVEDIT
ncbi:LLM class flavin-dependent oxidoreductase [Actinomycetes bacterium KLBMP 9759]